MKKKCLFIMIPIIIMLAFTGKESVISVKAETRDDYSYELKEDGSYTITGYNGSENEVVIPNKINGKKVTSIGNWAFYGCSNLTIYGEENSVVERYANERGINFIID